jgi:putative ABC transport system permease protein
MRTFWRDVRYGVRMLRKAPGFTATALITLAVGIGANVLSFSVADALLLRPVGVKDPPQLVCCDISDMLIDYFAYLTISDSHQAFSGFTAQSGGRSVTLSGQDMGGQAEALFVSANYFSLLGVAPTRGRGFLPEEDRQDSTPAVVLSHRLWQRQGADPDIVGQSLRINGVPCQVVGVAPEGFTGITLAGPDLWLPMGSYLSTMVLARGESKPPAKWRFDEYPFPVIPVGRLKSGVSLAGAQASLQPVAARLKAQFPRDWTARSSLYLHLPSRIGPMFTGPPGKGAIYRANERWMIAKYSLFLLGVSGTILVIACFNLANMLMIRGTSRGREMALRLALGGGRLQIIRQLLIEALLLALLGGVLGLFLAFWGTNLLNAWFAASQQLRWRCLQTNLSLRVLGMTLAVSLMATLLFGLRPALGLSRRDVMAELKESGGAMPGPVKGRRGGLSVFCQVALTVVLVMIAVMFTRRALVLARPDESFHPENTLVVELDPLSAGYDRTRSIQACQMLADRLEALPGIASLGVSPSFSFGNYGVDSIYTYIPGAKSDDSERLLATAANTPPVGGDYFPSVGLPLLQGRSFSRLDSAPGAEKVVIIDEHLARKLDPNGQALDKWIRFGWFSDRSEPYRVVGVVARIPPSTHHQMTFVQTYTPAQPDQMCPVFYLRLKDPRSATTMRQQVLAALRAVDPYVPVLSIATLADKRCDHGMVWFAAMCVRLTGTAGAIALFLAALGIWAVKGFMVASRTHEIGIRKALGATPREIVGMVFKEGLLLTTAGLLVGLLLGWGATRMIASALYGYKAIDPVGMVVSGVLLGTVSFLAGCFPARRAAQIDPMVALRYE